MADPFISVRARDVDAVQLNEALSRYLAYERLRAFRGHLVPRLGWLLLTLWMSTRELHLLPTAALIVTGVASVAATTAVVTAERRARKRVGQTMRDWPLQPGRD